MYKAYLDTGLEKALKHILGSLNLTCKLDDITLLLIMLDIIMQQHRTPYSSAM